MANPFGNVFTPPGLVGRAATPMPAAPAPGGSPFDTLFTPSPLVGTGAPGAPAFEGPDVATPPIAAAGPSATPMFAPPPGPSPAGRPNFLSMALPVIASALIGHKDPRAMAAGLAAFMQGREMKRTERESVQQRDERRRTEQADFYSRAMTQAQTFDDPVAFEQWKHAIAPVAQVHGIDPSVFTFSDAKLATRTTKDAGDLLDKLDKQHPDGNYTVDWKDAKTGATRRITRAELARLAGTAALDAQGQPLPPTSANAFKPSTPDEMKIAAFARSQGKRVEDLTPAEIADAVGTGKPSSTPTLGTFEDYVTRYAKARNKAPDTLTDREIEDARKRYNQADDKATGVSDVTQLTQAGLDMAALNYKTTGVMPALGMGDKVTRQRIINRAAELTADDMGRIRNGVGDIASNKANYKANSDTLTQLTKQRAAIGAFEQTAQKNIDLFLEQAGKVVDSGSPLANRALRTISGQILGSPNQAAFDAARQVAINEIAKITSNPTLSGTLSDSARHEVEAFNPQSATLKQSVAVMRLLKRDMANRIKSLDDELASVQNALRGGSTTEKPAKANDPLGIL